MNQTVWKYESGDKKSIFGKPYTYNGTKWVPDEGVKTDNKGKEKVGANVNPKEADNFLKENGLEHIDMLSTKSVRRLFEHHGIDWKAQSPKERLNELIKIYGTGSGTKKEEKPKEEKPKEEKPKEEKPKEDFKLPHVPEEEAIWQKVTDDDHYNDLAEHGLQNITRDQTKAIAQYAESSFMLNSTLRSGREVTDKVGEKPTDDEETKRDIQNIRLIDEAFKNAPPIGVQVDVIRATLLPPEVFSQLSVGAGYRDKGFASTSTDKAVADDFHQIALDNNEEHEILCTMKIKIPKEARVLPIAPIAEEVGYGFQKEVLINRNSTYKVTRIKRNGDQAEVHLELVV